jgi:hypothetical protein
MNADYERTSYEANLDLGYAIVVSEMHCKLFGRVKKGITLINLVSGTGAFASALATHPHISAVCGFLVAVLSCIDLVCDPGKSADAHAKDFAEYIRLKGRSAGKSFEWIDSRKAKIDANASRCLSGLSLPAFNSNLRSHGRYEAIRPLSRWERFLEFLV